MLKTASALVVTDAMSVLRPVETVLRRTRGGRPGLAIMTFRRRSSQTCFNRLEPLKELLNLFVVLTRTFIRGLPKDLSQDRNILYQLVNLVLGFQLRLQRRTTVDIGLMKCVTQGATRVL